jgi:hypothetical protein
VYRGKGGVEIWWAHQDSNLEPKRYEHSALTIELWALAGKLHVTVINRNQAQLAQVYRKETNYESPALTIELQALQ